MPQQTLNSGNRNALMNQQGGTSMPGAMESDRLRKEKQTEED